MDWEQIIELLKAMKREKCVSRDWIFGVDDSIELIEKVAIKANKSRANGEHDEV